MYRKIIQVKIIPKQIPKLNSRQNRFLQAPYAKSRSKLLPEHLPQTPSKFNFWYVPKKIPKQIPRKSRKMLDKMITFSTISEILRTMIYTLILKSNGVCGNRTKNLPLAIVVIPIIFFAIPKLPKKDFEPSPRKTKNIGTL
jgi:hypothetical protein